MSFSAAPSVRRLTHLLRGRKAVLTLLCTLALAGSLAEAFTAVGLGLSVEGMTRAEMSLVGGAAAFMALLVGMRVTSSVVAHAVSKRAEISLGIELKQAIGDHLASTPSFATKRIPLGEAVETAGEDTDTVAGVIGVARGLIVSSATFLGVGVYLLSQSVALGGIVLLSAPLLALGVPRMTTVLARRLAAHRSLAAEVAALATDAASGSRVLRGTSAEPAFLARFRRTSSAMFDTGLNVAGLRAVIEGAKVFIPTAVLVVVLLVGVGEIDRGALTVPQLVTFYGLGLALVPCCSTFLSATQDVAPLLVGLARMEAILQTGSEQCITAGAADDAGPRALTDPLTGLVATAGRFTAVTSPSIGSLRDVASRLAGLDGGSTISPLLGGSTISDIDRSTLRRSVLLAEGDAYLFAGNLRQTLLGSGETDRRDADLLHSLSAAGAEDVLTSIGGLDGHVSAGGRNLSGGQRQRLTLARALVRDPEVLVLFEPTNAVDVATESRIADRVREHRAGRTTLVFSNSPAFAAVADVVAAVDLSARKHAEGVHA